MMATSSEWVQYFENNNENLMSIPWNSDYHLTPQERRTISSSIQQFQLGESSEGKRLINLAQSYARKNDDADYVRATELFILEEQRHAADLMRLMEHENIPPLKTHPVDGIFRVLRRAFNLELAIVVLLTAEIIAVTYYAALHDATQSPILQTICRQILRDEVKHLNFQRDTLTKLRDQRSTMMCWITCQLQRLLFANTLLIVWFGHHKVYQAAGFSFSKFIITNWSRFQHVSTLTTLRIEM